MEGRGEAVSYFISALAPTRASASGRAPLTTKLGQHWGLAVLNWSLLLGSARQTSYPLQIGFVLPNQISSSARRRGEYVRRS
jgi:hypothetical protein